MKPTTSLSICYSELEGSCLFKERPHSLHKLKWMVEFHTGLRQYFGCRSKLPPDSSAAPICMRRQHFQNESTEAVAIFTMRSNISSHLPLLQPYIMIAMWLSIVVDTSNKLKSEHSQSLAWIIHNQIMGSFVNLTPTCRNFHAFFPLTVQFFKYWNHARV